MSSEIKGDECTVQGGETAGPSAVEPQKKDLACILCGKKMFYEERFRVNVCLESEHGVLAYYGLDSCYFTSREDIGVRFAKEGRKFHMIEASVLEAIGVKP